MSTEESAPAGDDEAAADDAAAAGERSDPTHGEPSAQDFEQPGPQVFEEPEAYVVEEPVAHFEDPYKPKPQRYSAARGQVPPSRPLDPILPYIAPPVPRRRRSDWPVLVLALIVSALIMAGCCVAGFALYTGYGWSFH